MDKLKIQVTTIPNGYALTVGSEDYMYFTKAALLEGFMYHVGLEELSAVDEETMRDFIAASIAWRDNAEAVKSLVGIRKENELLIKQINNLKKQVKRLCEKQKEEPLEDS